MAILSRGRTKPGRLFPPLTRAWHSAGWQRWRGKAAPAVGLLSWLYLAAALYIALLLWAAPESWWLATFLRYSPSWVWALPAAGLVPAALVLRRRSLLPVLAGLVVVVGPVMGFCLPWRCWFAAPSAPALRVLTCNLDGDAANVAAFSRLVAESGPDIVALQESPDRKSIRWPEGWHFGRQTAGVVLASRFDIHEVDHFDFLGLGMGGEAFVNELTTPEGKFSFVNIHLPTLREGIAAVEESALDGVGRLQEVSEKQRDATDLTRGAVDRAVGPLLIAGDLNMPTTSAVYRHYWSPYTNAFSVAGLGFGYSKYTSWHGVRIDHVLAGPGWRFRRCWVGPDVGSDHRPVFADVERTGGWE
jgi:endonuclease/exonuclease/phosphatase (EEP) superfamily protein YafD